MISLRRRLQNGTQYKIYLTRDDGSRLKKLDTVVRFEYTNGVNTVGHFKVELPGTFDRSLLAYDRRVMFWRKPMGGTFTQPFQGIVRKITTHADANANITRVIEGHHLNYLLSGRVIAYLATSAQATQTAAADTMLKALASQNLGTTSTDTRRALSSSIFTVAPTSVVNGPSLTKNFSYEDLLTAMQSICNTARSLGTEVYFAIVPTTETQFEYRTFLGRLGNDRRAQNAGGLTFSLARENLWRPVLVEDADAEVNFAYALGRGTDLTRNVQVYEDTTRSLRSLFGRREGKIDARQETTDAALITTAQAAVIKGRPTTYFTADLRSIPGSVYDLDWSFGDSVTIDFDKRQFDANVRAATVAVADTGVESITATAEAYL